MVNTPIGIGRFSVIMMGTTAIGFAIGTIAAAINVDLIEEIPFNTDKAAILAAGNKHFKVTWSSMYIDNTYATQALNGTPVDFVVYPRGTTFTGKPKFTVKNCIITVWNFKSEAKGIVNQDGEAHGNDFVISTV
jgi:hypothetical protein